MKSGRGIYSPELLAALLAAAPFASVTGRIYKRTEQAQITATRRMPRGGIPHGS